MKVVCLLGNPRENGNSSALANHFCNTAERLGAQVQTFVLNKLNPCLPFCCPLTEGEIYQFLG
ncbi:NAD(P)H-dependent oxidoreductase [Desulforhabdus amnigena]|uniref:NAD(P)H-dependent oxidoreductase n=1 Tax=Desulforhabdus amnigena TaxID=40218 RepID=UPI0016971F75|nr:NAD(P)H-dependent oxidoreductase [Deltaproteobacteria bacterium]